MPVSQYISIPSEKGRAGTDDVRKEIEKTKNYYYFLIDFYDKFGEKDREKTEDACLS